MSPKPESFHANVLSTIDRWDLLPAGSRVGVAISGGADSVALFRILSAASHERGWTLLVLHVNHELRGSESDGDAAFVERLSAAEGLLCKIYVSPVPLSGNIEENARDLRRACLENFRALHRLHRIALGHTRSDQAETVLFRFLRGAGTAGLTGMRPLTPGGLVRPLLEQTREGVRDYLRSLGQTWREDSSNGSRSFDRNRIRLDLLPALARDWNPRIESTLAQTAEWARAEEDYWTALTTAFAKEHFQLGPGPTVIFPTTAIVNNEANEDLPVAVARRVLRHAAALVRGDLHSIDFLHIERLLALFREKEGSRRLQIPGLDILRSFDWIRFAPPGSYGSGRDFSATLSVPGCADLPGGNSSLVLQIENSNSRYNDNVNCLDGDRLPGLLTVRAWQPGDRYRQVGRTSETKLKTLFQDARIPLWDRSDWPVLVIGDAIVWTRRFGAAADFAAAPSARRVVRVSENVAGSRNSSSRNWNQDPGSVRL